MVCGISALLVLAGTQNEGVQAPAGRMSYEVPVETQIHGPRAIGVSPGRTLLFRVPATGKKPLRFRATGLPEGLRLDPESGIITGTPSRAGAHDFHIQVTGPAGVAQRKYRLVVSLNSIAMTPPMGWNSWNIWGKTVDAAKIQAAATAMVREELVNYGYAYVNIDDGWQGQRDGSGTLQPNSRFPNIKRLVDSIHRQGLKVGIYSSPGAETCGGFPGSLDHEKQDATTFASWGIDYLKYDLCTYRNLLGPKATTSDHRAPYQKMAHALTLANRDIVFSLSQYGLAGVEQWGKAVGGHLWRTTPDLHDNWKELEQIAFSQPRIASASRPNGWNDPDMLAVGVLGWGEAPRPSRLTQDEQITHLTAWSMLAAPLILGCDLNKLDRFTKALITNHDMIEIDQDPMGKAATVLYKLNDAEVWIRTLHDGSKAVAMFNRSDTVKRMGVRWTDIGMRGKVPVRDVWMRKDLTPQEQGFQEEVPPHGAVLIRVGKIAE
jgi:alpha-galactosidase